MIHIIKKCIIFIFLSFLLVFLINYKKNENKNYQEISDSQKTEIIENMNYNFAKINNISVKLDYGSIIYQKELDLMSNFNFFNINSNEEYFWYYIKNQIYYCKHTDLFRTRLKSFLYPKIIKSILGVDELNYYKISQDQNYIICYEKIYENIIKKTFISQNKIIKYEFYENEVLILVVNILDFTKVDSLFLPKNIKLNIIQEKQTFNIKINDIKINQDIKINKLPKDPNKINLKDY